MQQEYDVVVIGAGSGGISAANLVKGLGKRVALVEKRKIGGDCTWYGCVPSKALIRAGEVAHLLKHHRDFGLRLETDGAVLAKGALHYVQRIRQHVYEGETPEVFRSNGIDVHIGAARFVDAHRLQVGDRVVKAKKFIIATGSSPAIPPIKGLDTVPYLTNESIFELETLPESLLILGGGPIGIELAAALNRLGVQVTVVEMLERILIREEPELVEMLHRHLEAEGVRLLTATKAHEAFQESGTVGLRVEKAQGNQEKLKADALLIAVGRKPNVHGLELEKADVAYSPQGIQVNERLQTTAAHIFACGDVASPFQFSHMAEYQATIAARNAVLPRPLHKKVHYENVPWCTFTDPELARCGLTESEAREKYGDRIRVFRYSLSHIDRAKTDGTAFGMSKFITDRKGKLLGIHILAPHAGDLIHEALLAKTLGIPFQKIADMIHIYPTYGDLTKRPAIQCYLAILQDKPIVRFFQWLRKFFK